MFSMKCIFFAFVMLNYYSKHNAYLLDIYIRVQLHMYIDSYRAICVDVVYIHNRTMAKSMWIVLSFVLVYRIEGFSSGKCIVFWTSHGYESHESLNRGQHYSYRYHLE